MAATILAPKLSGSSGLNLRNPKLTKFIDDCRVLIVGAGVTGLSEAYVLSRFSNAHDIIVIEKYDRPAQVNSHPRNNAQTSHEGDTETNYSLNHALEVKKSAIHLRRYIDRKNNPNLSQKRMRMAIAVTKDEVKRLVARYEEIKPYYPHLRLMYYDDISKIEPNVTKGRDPKKPFCAIVSTEGYIVNYQELADDFLKDSQEINPQIRCMFNTALIGVEKINGGYSVETSRGKIFARTIEFAAGPYSLYYAQQMGYGLEYGILSVAGSFYEALNEWLKNKVYRMQIKGRPFAEVHGDPDILDMKKTRFGPTTKPLPLMERHHYETFKDFMKLPLLTSLRGITSLFKIIFKHKLLWYVFKNLLFDTPIIGKLLFLQEVKKIVPTMRYRDLKLRKGAGGIRPQIVNLKTMDLEMGDASLVPEGERLIFNTTPSPGASVCLGNAHRDAKRIVEFLNQTGGGYYFDEEAFQKELGEVKAH